MIVRTFTLAIALQLFGGPASAVGETDHGVYLVVNTKGEVTTKAFRVLQRGAEWAIEDRKSDGFWSDVTCEA